MRPITYALIASLALAAVLAGCAGTPGESANDTSQVGDDITVTCPEDNTTTDANMSTNATDCPGMDNSTTMTNTSG